MKRKINWFAIAAGVSTIVLIFVSFLVPWWYIKMGDGLVQVNVSPVNTNFELIGNSFTVPLIWALNLASLLTLAAGGIVMLIYSLLNDKPYSKKLLGFAYKKPIYSIILFIVMLIVLLLTIQAEFGFQLSLFGSSIIQLPESLTQGIKISVLVLTGFGWTFWLAVVTAGLCISARFYHTKIILPASKDVEK